jgi:hypothetical protein
MWALRGAKQRLWFCASLTATFVYAVTNVDAVVPRSARQAGNSVRAETTDEEIELATLGLPSNIRFDEHLRKPARTLLLGSRTFREQCVRLGRISRLAVDFKLDIRLQASGRRYRARCVIARYEFGRIVATVRIASFESVAELVAHELEHVSEYVDGVNYRQSWSRGESGVWMDGDGHFETSRAITAGRSAADEVHAAARSACAKGDRCVTIARNR